MSTDTTPAAWADSKEAWTTRVHDAVLDSGTKVTYRDLSVAELAMLEELPSELLEIAVDEWAQPGSGAEKVQQPHSELPKKPTKKQRDAADVEARRILGQIMDVNRRMVALALVEPKLTPDELQHVPMPDLERLAALINRTVASDAEGRRVGVVPVDRFRVVLEAHGHEQCAADCPSCEKARRGLSTIR